jgi:hypothetical protein
VWLIGRKGRLVRLVICCLGSELLCPMSLLLSPQTGDVLCNIQSLIEHFVILFTRAPLLCQHRGPVKLGECSDGQMFVLYVCSWSVLVLLLLLLLLLAAGMLARAWCTTRASSGHES